MLRHINAPQDTAPHMAYRRAKAESVITGLERPINDHLIKLFAVRPDALPPQTEAHWRHELRNWLDDVADIRLKPHAAPAARDFYYRILFDEPFGGVEALNVGRRLRRLTQDGYALREPPDAAAIAGRLQRFHAVFAAACAAGSMTPEAIQTLMASLPDGL